MKCKNCITYPLVAKLPDDAYGVVCAGCALLKNIIIKEGKE